MATLLFNNQVEELDISSLYAGLLSTSLLDLSAENAISEALYRIQVSQLGLINAGEAYTEEIFANSKSTIYTKTNKIESSGIPTIEATIVDIGVEGIENSIGLMTSSAAFSAFTQHYWQMGDSVEISNKSIVAVYAGSTLDSIITREIVDNFFLKTTPEEILTGCHSAFVQVSDIRDVSIDGKKAVNYSDMQRFYFLISDFIDLSIKNLSTPSYSINEHNVNMAAIELPSKVELSSLVTKNGTVSLKNFEDSFLSEGGYLSNRAALGLSVETNTVSMIGMLSTLSQLYAPKKDWKARDIKKEDTKDVGYMTLFISNLLAGDSPVESRDLHSVVSRGEVETVLDILIEEILAMDVCDDN